MKAVFIDFVNTLIEFDKIKFFNRASVILNISEEKIKQIWKESWKPLYFEYSSGEKWATEDFWKLVFEKSGIQANNTEVLHRLFLSCQLPIEGSKLLLEILNSNYKIVLLTNEITEWVNETLKMFEMDKYFDEVIVSQDVGCRKPDKRIFDFALGKANEQPENCFFISDEPNELEFAKQMGMKTFLVENKNLAPIIDYFKAI